jgi:hypothetical protein
MDKKRFSIITVSYNEYELLRQLIESIQINVDRDTYDKIIVIDDFSELGTKLTDYLEYLKYECCEDVQVISFPEYRYIRFYQKEAFENKVINDAGFNYERYSNSSPTMCYPTAIWLGLQLVPREIEFAFCVHLDIVFLKESKDLLIKLADIFDKFSDCMISGQAIGLKNNGIVESYKMYECLGGRSKAGGYIGCMATAFRMDAWRIHKLCPTSSSKRNSAAYNRFQESLFETDRFSSVSYPLFSEKYLLHVGNGSVRRNMNLDKNSSLRSEFPYCRDFKHRYGSRHSWNKLTDYQTGSHCIDMTSKEYFDYLVDKYSISFDEIQPPLDENLVIPVESLCG